MKRFFSLILVFMIFFSLFVPTVSFAQGSTLPPEKPYELTATKFGNWYSERVRKDNATTMVVKYNGEIEETVKGLKFSLNDNILFNGLYLPYNEEMKLPQELEIVDSLGTLYKGFKMIKVDDTLIKFETPNNIRLGKGNYTAYFGEVEVSTDFFIKGYNSEAYDNYKNEYRKWYAKENPEAGELSDYELGLESFDETKDISDIVETKNPAIFELESEHLVSSIMVNTFNGGKGATPGIIAIYNETTEELVGSLQAYGGSIDDKTPNSMWTIEPEVVLPKGLYRIVLSEDVMAYDKDGNGMFYVMATDDIPEYVDFSGTYKIDIVAENTGTKSGKQKPAFELKDFEIAVLDYGVYAEVVGIYEEMPFSQIIEYSVVEEEKIEGAFALEVPMGKKLGNLTVEINSIVFSIKNNNPVISMAGTAVYTREDDGLIGGDYNTYNVNVTGFRVKEELPPFVLAALHSQNNSGGGDVGNVPGPDSPEQAATGMLFPPLVGVVGMVLSEALKKNLGARRAVARAARDAANENSEGALGDDLNEGGDESGDTYEGIEEVEDVYEEQVSEEYVDEPTKPEEEDPYAGLSEEDKEILKNRDPEEVAAEEYEKYINSLPEKVVVDPLTKNEIVYKQNPETGEWFDPKTGYAYSQDDYNIAAGNAVVQQEWLEECRIDNEKPNKYMQAKMKELEKKYENDVKMDKLEFKYGTRDKEELRKIMKEKQAIDKATADTWTKIGNVYEAAEVTATVVGAAADTAIDLYGNVNPSFAMGYKAIKGIAGNVADKGMSTASVVEGGIKGAADAATVLMGKIPAAKAVTTIAGETLGSMAGEKLKKDGIWQTVKDMGSGTVSIVKGDFGNVLSPEVAKAAENGYVDGVFNATVGYVTDKAVGKFLPEFSVKEFTNAKGFVTNAPQAFKALFGAKHGAAQVTTTNLVKDNFVKPLLNPFKKQ